MTTQDEQDLKNEIQRIFDSGANEIRIFEMVKTFIGKRQRALNLHDVIKCVPYQKCPVCEGSGQIYVSQLNPYETNVSIGYNPCNVCGGNGIIPMAHCL